MATPENVVALEMEVAEVIGILLETLPEEGAGQDDIETLAEGIRRYADQVERIGSVAATAGFFGLQDVCLLYQEQLTHLGGRSRALTAAERERLEEWPTLVIDYLGSPMDVQASTTLVEHLENPVWEAPLLPDEAEVLKSLLVTPPPEDLEDVAVFEAGESKTELVEVDGEAALLADETAAKFEAEAKTGLIPEPPVAGGRDVVENVAVAVESAAAGEMPEPVATAEVEVGIQYIPIPAEAETASLVDGEVEATLPAPALEAETAPPPVDEEIEATPPAPALEFAVAGGAEVRFETAVALPEASLVTGAAAEGEREWEVAAAAATPDELGEATAAAAEEAEEEATAEEEAAPVAGEPRGASGAEQELLDILLAEIGQMTESADEILAVARAPEQLPAARREALENYAERVERLSEAAESVGLSGLRKACSQVHANLMQLAVQERALTDDQQDIVTGWLDPVLAYLQALNDRAAATELVRYLQDGRWLVPLPSGEAMFLAERLATGRIIAEASEAEARPAVATPDLVSLQLPEDVNPELLDSLLQELPGQTAEFSGAVQRLVAGEGTLQDVDVAKRIAHTVKGAGNTVGVRGIAVLTHHIEDILLAFTKHNALPNRALAATLMSAADCLESMSEALVGMSPPPDHALDVLQEVLDWANRIDREGIPTTDEAPVPRAALPAATEAADSAAAAPAAAAGVPLLRVPAPLVDDLLRLAGESIILNGQVQERLRKTLQNIRLVATQNRLLQQLTAELEQLVNVRNVSSPLSRPARAGFDPLELEQYNELNTVTHRLLEAVVDSTELERGMTEQLKALDALLINESRLNRDSQEAVLRTRMVPIQTVVPRLQRSVRQTCRLVDKEADLVIRGAETLIDSNVLNEVVDPLMHLLRNAVDHGIEPAAVRASHGKQPVGRIELSFFREGNSIIIRCQDDGAGLDSKTIRRKAEERGLLAPNQVMDEEELHRLILLPGFSTSAQATQTSGRGIGLDMAYSRLLEMKGSLRIQSRVGAGCLMEMRLPVTLISTHALLVRLRNQVYAVSNRGIEQILYSGTGVITRLGNTATFQIGDEMYELSMLDTLLNLPVDRRERTRATPPVLLVREEAGAIRAVMVQEVLDSRDLVVKSLGSYVPRMNGIVGATILGDGSVVPVLDLPEMLRTPVVVPALRPAAETGAAEAGAGARLLVALVVDDSLSARRSLAQFIQDAGFEVRTARDGMEAVDVISGKRPDLLLVDLEMPRMNGLELTSHLRASAETRDLPVIMVTSRSTDKHRREAEAAGVNVYLTKPFGEDELLTHIRRLLGRT